MYTQDDMTTNTPSPMFRPLFAVKCLSIAALATSLTAPSWAADKVSMGSGDWNSITWSPAGTPIAADTVHIEGGFSVNYPSGSSPSFFRVYVGDNTGALPSSNGTLNISGGTLTVNGNAIGAYVVGRSDGSIGTVNLTGGTMRTTGGNGGGLQVGLGANSQGVVNVNTGASLRLTGGVQLGIGNGSSGSMKVTGGIVTTSTSTNTDSKIFYVGFRSTGSTTGNFEQTGGTVTVNDSDFMAIGFSANSSQNTVGTVLLTGGTFNGNVRIGRESGSGGGGSGTLTIGANADVNGLTQAWEVSGTGEVIFELGTSFVFNAVDLTLASSNALVFSELGAKVTIDGSSLLLNQESYVPISLFTFAAGAGPSETSKANVVFGYTGFDPGWTPELVWTDTSLQLNLTAVPEPSTMALAIAAGLGWVAIRRRRR